jgi:retinol dehydrogenase 12
VHIVTGGYAGCGYELAKLLYKLNATVYVAGRSQEKADKAISNLKSEVTSSKGRLEFLKVDLADLASIKASAEDFMKREKRLDVLTNNAGVMVPPLGSKTAQGFELQMGTNCLGPFLFTQLLLPVLRETAASSPPGAVRVTWAASAAADLAPKPDGIIMEDDGTPMVGKDIQADYAMSKAGNVFYAKEFARRYGKDGIVSCAWNPGNLTSELQRHLSSIQAFFVVSASEI